MDNPSTESGALDINSGAAAFAALLEPEVTEGSEEVKAEEPTEEEATEEPTEEPEAESEPEKVIIKVDGKDVELTPEQIAEAVKGQMRQADYTRKTMEVANQRKEAQAEMQKARDERAKYSQTLKEQEILLSSALKEQDAIDWQTLLNTDPVEYLKQQHLYQQRQTALIKTKTEFEDARKVHEAEEQKAYQLFLVDQERELLDKLPEWKDAEKAKIGKSAVRDYLIKNGFTEQEVNNIANHRAVLMSYKAMKYDEMIDKASAAAKKVSNLPKRIESPGVSETKGNDQRNKAFQQLKKTGRVEDAAKVFASFL